MKMHNYKTKIDKSGIIYDFGHLKKYQKMATFKAWKIIWPTSEILAGNRG